jgi:hypothetical protein
MAGFKAGDRSSRAARRLIRMALAASLGCLALAAFSVLRAPAQVLTVSQSKIDGQYLDFHPTNVPLPTQPLDSQTRQELIRIMDAEQGFAMRPLPKGTHGIVLHANGAMNPVGPDYASALRELGTSVKPGDRVVISDVRISGNRMVFDLNGGPEKKHRFLRHIEIGAGGGVTTPIVHDDGTDPSGSRLTLMFDKSIPALTGTQVKQLLAPIVDFGVKTPAQAYADTLPPMLKQAILDHHVLVGMDTKMVLSALGQPDNKSREREGDMPFEEWIYGEPPQDVQFIRINGNRVIRVEIAKLGQPPVIRAENEVGNYWATGSDAQMRTVNMGDADPASINNPDKAPAAPPSLRRPGETLPQDQDVPQQGKVQFPKPKPDKPPESNPESTPDDQKTPDSSTGGDNPSNSGSSTPDPGAH